MLSATDLQLQTLRLYGELIARRTSHGGQMVFTCGEGCSTTGLPAAVSIAGGCTLALDPDGASVKSTFRQGGVDFVVNTLDEALRVLKNEVRQHKPLGVALISETEPVLAEMRERGVLPDLQVTVAQPGNPLLIVPAAIPAIDGAAQLDLANVEGIAAVTDTLAQWLAERSFTETVVEPKSSLRVLDEELLAVISVEDNIRRNWVQRISHYQRASPGASRVLWMTADEKARKL